MTSKIKRQERKELWEFRVCSGHVEVSKAWAVLLYRVQWACLDVCLCVCTTATGVSVCGGFNSFKTKFTALIKQTLHQKEHTRWQMEVPTHNKELCCTVREGSWLISIYQDILQSESRDMILINTGDNWNHPGKLRYMVITLIIMYHKVRENHGGLPRSVEIAKGYAVTSISSSTDEPGKDSATDSGLRSKHSYCRSSNRSTTKAI